MRAFVRILSDIILLRIPDESPGLKLDFPRFRNRTKHGKSTPDVKLIGGRGESEWFVRKRRKFRGNNLYDVLGSI